MKISLMNEKKPLSKRYELFSETFYGLYKGGYIASYSIQPQ